MHALLPLVLLLPTLVAARAPAIHLRRAAIHCNFTTVASPGDSCALFASRWGMTLPQFRSINPGVNCQPFDSTLEYCAIGQVVPDLPANTTTTTTTTSSASAPTTTSTSVTTATTTTPVFASTSASASASPTTAAATTFATAIANATATSIARAATSTILDIISSMATSALSATLIRPSPIQPGITTSCDVFHKVSSGDTCAALESRYGISPDQFIAWNPSVNQDCSNLWLNYFVCVHTPGAPTNTTAAPSQPAQAPASTSSQPAAAQPAPQPQMPNITRSCRAFHQVSSGEDCRSISRAANITTQQLLDWNPAVDANCSNLWLGYFVCVGV